MAFLKRMSDTKPELLLIAGPNGAGKTTFINTYLPEYTNVREFVNADLIAKGISPFEPEGAMIEAGRIELNRIAQFLKERRSFAVESTISGKSAYRWIEESRVAGYNVKLFYIYLNSPELSIQRIAERVRKGGHHIPSDVARRRYGRSIRNLFDIFVPLAEEVQIFDNSSDDFLEVARVIQGEWIILDSVLMEHVKASATER
jgi:predicted ABC-type ATPase